MRIGEVKKWFFTEVRVTPDFGEEPDYVAKHTVIEKVDVYQILRAVGQMEHMLQLTAHTRYELPQARG